MPEIATKIEEPDPIGVNLESYPASIFRPLQLQSRRGVLTMLGYTPRRSVIQTLRNDLGWRGAVGHIGVSVTWSCHWPTSASHARGSANWIFNAFVAKTEAN